MIIITLLLTLLPLTPINAWPDCPSCSSTAADLMGGTLDDDGWRALSPSNDSRVIHVSSSEGDNSNDGLTPDSPVETIAFARTLLRDEYPDWLLLKRGDDFYETIPRWSTRGRSVEEPSVLGSYGDNSTSPRLMTGMNVGFTAEYRPRSDEYSNPARQPISNLVIVGLHFFAHTNDHYYHDDEGNIVSRGHENATISPLDAVPMFFNGKADNIWLEDLVFEGYGNGNVFTADSPAPDDPTCFPNCHLVEYEASFNMTVRRCRIYDIYANSCDPDHPDFPCPDGGDNGFFIDAVDGLLFEENLIDYNSWHEGESSLGVFDKGLYLRQDPKSRNIYFRRNIVSRQQEIDGRPGGFYEDNLFLRLNWSLNFGVVQCCETIPGGITGRVSHNVFLEDPVSQGDRPALQGLVVNNVNGTLGAEVSYNIFAHGSGAAAIRLEAFNDKGVGIQSLAIHHNVIYNWGGVELLQGLTCEEQGLQCNEGTAQQEPQPPRNISFHENIHYQTNCPSCDCGTECGIVRMGRFTSTPDPNNGFPIFGFGPLLNQDEYSLSNNEYLSNGCEDMFFTSGVGNATFETESYNLDEWIEFSGDDNSNFVNMTFNSPNRTIAAYCEEELGGICNGIDSFCEQVRTQSKGSGLDYEAGTLPQSDTWDTRLTASEVNEWVRLGMSEPNTVPATPGQSNVDHVEASCPIGGGECNTDESREEHATCLAGCSFSSCQLDCSIGLAVNDQVAFCVAQHGGTITNEQRQTCVEDTFCYRECFQNWADCCEVESPESLFKCNNLYDISDREDEVSNGVCAQNLKTCIDDQLFPTSPSEYPTSSPPPSFMSASPTSIADATSMPTLNLTSPPTTVRPISQPTNLPTSAPTSSPTGQPPTQNPTGIPTMTPTFNPTSDPTNNPTSNPTSRPTDQPTNVESPSTHPDSVNLYMVGHSLIGMDLPITLHSISEELEMTMQFRHQVLNGAGLRWNWLGNAWNLLYTTGSGWRNNLSNDDIWDNGYPPAVDHANNQGIIRDDMLSGEFDTLIITEGFDGQGEYGFDEQFHGLPDDDQHNGVLSSIYGGVYYDLAVTANADTRVFLYESWPPLGNDWVGTWREQIVDYRDSAWGKIIEDVNSDRVDVGSPPMRMIPAGQAMKLAYDAIENGELPTITSMDQMLPDGVHQEGPAHHLVACVMYATIYGRSPVGVTGTVYNHNNPMEPLDEALALKLQEIAWEAVLSDPDSGVSEDGSGPTSMPVTGTPTSVTVPTFVPTGNPTTSTPILSPTQNPTGTPSHFPTSMPAAGTPTPVTLPTSVPTGNPTTGHPPTQNPTSSPTMEPTRNPTFGPTHNPTSNPTNAPTDQPTLSPTGTPTRFPTSQFFSNCVNHLSGYSGNLNKKEYKSCKKDILCKKKSIKKLCNEACKFYLKSKKNYDIETSCEKAGWYD